MKSEKMSKATDDTNKKSRSGAGASRGRGRGRGRGGASGFGPAPRISKRPVNSPAPENPETNFALSIKKHLMDNVESVIAEGHLNKDFLRLLHTEATHPYFMGNLIYTFFNESEKLLVELTDAINNHSAIDLKKVDKLLKLLKTKCSRIGAQKLHDDCVGFINSPDGCRARLSCLQMDYSYLKNFNLEFFLTEERYYSDCGGTHPL